MNYSQICTELEAASLKDQFINDLENAVSENLLNSIKTTNKIHSTASLIRMLMISYQIGSEKRLFWQKALLYFMMPEFARDKKTLPVASGV